MATQCFVGAFQRSANGTKLFAQGLDPTATQFAEAQVAVGHEWAHAEFLGQGRRVMRDGRRHALWSRRMAISPRSHRALPPYLWREFVQEGLGLLEVGRVKALGEPTIDRSKLGARRACSGL